MGRSLNLVGKKSGKIKSCGCVKTEKQVKRMKEDPISGLVSNLYASYKQKAKKSGKEFNITKKYFRELIFSNCHYCDSKPMNCKKDLRKNSKLSHILYNGVDRVNNDMGYVNNNCVPCCFVCNQAKHRLDKDYFLVWVKRVHKNITKRNGVENDL